MKKPQRKRPVAPAVLVADDHPIFRQALRASVARVCPAARVLECDSAASLEALAARHPDATLVLLDLLMPGAQDLSALRHLRRTHPALRVAICSGIEDAAVVDSALALGAVAYLPKSLPADLLIAALRTVLGGGRWQPPRAAPGAGVAQDREMDRDMTRRIESLSPQELRILLSLGDGRMNGQIALELGISQGTVKVHMTSILRKLGLARRTQAALMAQRVLRTQAAAGAAGAS